MEETTRRRKTEKLLKLHGTIEITDVSPELEQAELEELDEVMDELQSEAP